MRRLGISESVAMKVSGHRTLSTFFGCEIVDGSDFKAVAKKLDIKAKKMEIDNKKIIQRPDKIRLKQPYKHFIH